MSSVEPSTRLGRRQRSWPAVLGLSLVLLVGGCLGYVGYQLFGSNLVAGRAADREQDSLRARWQQSATPSRSPTRTPTRSPTPTPTGSPSPPAVSAGEAFALLRIPSWGSSFEVPVLAGTDLDELSSGVGHYGSTALPGQVGNCALVGHRITHGKPFARLLDLRVGDAVVVETRTAIYTYLIDVAPRDVTVSASASWVLDPVPGGDGAGSDGAGTDGAAPTQALLTLITAQDLFPSGDRSVGFGHLASTKSKD